MIAAETIRVATNRIKRGLNRIDKSLQSLDESDLWKDFNPHLVSVGNIILHLIGNVNQHLVAGLGRGDYTRHRDREFVDKPCIAKGELLDRLAETVGRAIGVLEELVGDDLEDTYTIQGMQYTGTGDVLAVLEHFSYHVGQIVFATKLLKKASLELSDDAALNR